MADAKMHLDQHSFQKIYLKHHRKIWAFALRHLKDEANAEDIVHDVFLKLWEKRTDFSTDDQLEPLLFTITRNLLATHYRRSILEKESLPHLYWQGTAPEVDPDEEKISTIRAAIEALPPRRKQIYHMSRTQGLTYDEIAEELSISKNTVEVQLVKARQFLRKRLAHLAPFFIFF